MYTEGNGNTPTSSLPHDDKGKCAKPARRRRRRERHTFKIKWAMHPTGKGKRTKRKTIRTATGGLQSLGRAEIERCSRTTHIKLPWISQALLANLPENVCRYEAIAALLINQKCPQLLPKLLAMLLPPAALYYQTSLKVALAVSLVQSAELVASRVSPWCIQQSEQRSFGNAIAQLHTHTPFGAAKAHAAICNLKQAVIRDINTSGTLHSDLLTAVEVARKTVTDVLVMQCLALCENPQTSTFIEMVKHAYGGYMTTVIGDQVLNAYHLMNPRPIGFVSNNQVASNRIRRLNVTGRRTVFSGTVYSTAVASQLPVASIPFQAQPNAVGAENTR
jgi:hypothetical protein